MRILVDSCYQHIVEREVAMKNIVVVRVLVKDKWYARILFALFANSNMKKKPLVWVSIRKHRGGEVVWARIPIGVFVNIGRAKNVWLTHGADKLIYKMTLLRQGKDDIR
jgi:hypothetical protein